MKLLCALLVTVFFCFAPPLSASAPKPESSENAYKDQLEIPQDWSSCTTNQDCRLVHSGCNGEIVFAVQDQYSSAAQERAYERYGDPKTLNCTEGAKIDYTALCDPSSACLAAVISKEH